MPTQRQNSKRCILILLLINVSVFFLVLSDINAQTSDNIPNVEIDTNFVFTSPRPLIDTSKNSTLMYKNVGGFDLLLSNAGIGFGLIYDRYLNSDYKITSELFFSAMKNSDELEYTWDNDRYEYIVKNKIHRLYILPLNVGLQRYIYIGNLTKSFRPFVTIAAVPTIIWEMPYENNWFYDVDASKFHFRVGASIQIGAEFGMQTTTLIAIKLRYTWTPFGKNGLESVKDSPIYNFGGFYLSLTLGNLF